LTYPSLSPSILVTGCMNQWRPPWFAPCLAVPAAPSPPRRIRRCLAHAKGSAVRHLHTFTHKLLRASEVSYPDRVSWTVRPLPQDGLGREALGPHKQAIGDALTGRELSETHKQAISGDQNAEKGEGLTSCHINRCEDQLRPCHSNKMFIPISEPIRAAVPDCLPWRLWLIYWCSTCCTTLLHDPQVEPT
jgi:hypothetical protein